MYISFKQLLFILAIIVITLSGTFYWLGSQSRATIIPTKEEERVASISESSTRTQQQTVPSSTPEVNAPTSQGVVTTKPKSPTITAQSVTGKMAPELIRPGGFTNTDPFLLSDLRGKKIVLVEFWTTSSMNAGRTIPYLNDWYLKYHNYGLSIVAIHTPRFIFERSKTTVDQFAFTHNMPYAIVMDNGAETWTAYKNTTWPHLYLIDLDGKIVYDHAGEGSYVDTEKKLLSLLNSRAIKLKLPAPPDQTLTTPTSDVIDLTKLGSSETFFGSARNTTLANGTKGIEGVQTFDSLVEPKLNSLYLFGVWKITREYAESMTEHTSIINRFHAKHVYTIMGAQKILRVRVLLDGKPLTESNAGKDIRIEKGESVFYVDHEHFYDVVNLSNGYADHTIELIPESGGLDVYTLTFG
jgi:thiol-disulfide isomerase/thioredoxin